MPITRLEARELINRGYEMGAAVLTGSVERREDGTWVVSDSSLEDWLQALEGRAVVLVAAEIAEGAGVRRVCHTCGTEYEGHECPRCREVHRRLRGR
jgi:rRNA maturation endonuclease Nob1